MIARAESCPVYRVSTDASLTLLNARTRASLAALTVVQRWRDFEANARPSSRVHRPNAGRVRLLPLAG